MTFKDAVSKAPAPVAAALKPGLQALGADSAVVACSDPRRLGGSIDLDAALAESCPNASRWDYGVGVKTGRSERAVWIEVHTATTNEVKVVLAKVAWLKTWLREQAPALGNLTSQADRSFFWAATSAGVHIVPNSPQAKMLRQAGIEMPRKVVTIC